MLRLRDGVEEHAVPVRGEAGRFTATLTPAAIRSMAGTLPLREGTWRLFLRAGGRRETPVMVSPALVGAGPLEHTVAHKGFTFSPTGQDGAAILVERDLDDDERGPFHQRRLRGAIAAAGARPLRDAVVYVSFGGRQCSDNPRAIHEELVRRGAPLEHLWVVRDGAFAVPDGAGVLRKSSREYHEALATARYVVTNDLMPGWFRRADGQVVVQTLHGHPIRRQGFDIAAQRGKARRLLKGLDEQVANWSYLLSPGGRSTEFLRGAFGVEDGLLETGLPRTDVLAGEERAARAGGGAARRSGSPRTRGSCSTRRPTARRRWTAAGASGSTSTPTSGGCATPPGPTRSCSSASTRSSPTRRRRRATGSSTSRSSPTARSCSPAVDVLITDYSSMLADFAPTGLPLLCFGYDLEEYAETVRGFYVPFAETVPAPLLRTEDERSGKLQGATGLAQLICLHGTHSAPARSRRQRRIGRLLLVYENVTP